jgi:hypothetical protein
MTGPEPVDVIKHLRAFIYHQLGDVAPYRALQRNIYTGPNEDITQRAKYYCVIFYDYQPLNDELGDSLTRVVISIVLRMGARTDPTATRDEKQNADKFKYFVVSNLRSQRFRSYMEAVGVDVPPQHLIRTWDDAMLLGREGLRRFFVRMELVTYIDTYVPMPT